ncbi:MAG TPA: hypothetical protein PKL31_04805 [Fulvivirga sp.]|nr:hypothetical protein [Fulvivirga sp.]
MRGILYIIFLITICSCSGEESSIGPLNSSGAGGSLARFTINGNLMYVVNNTQLKTFDISQGNLSEIASVDLGVGIETIFPYGQYLFIGANDAVYIYSMEEGIPTPISTYTHATACDPIVVNGNYAYVSLRVNSCGQFTGENVVEIIDISDISHPVLIKSLTDVQSPYGLGINGNALYVCQGTNGLKIIDVSDPKVPVDINSLAVNAYDVIITQNRVILTGGDGIYQYDISNSEALQFLSKIAVGQK